jgi:hypothetical protein
MSIIPPDLIPPPSPTVFILFVMCAGEQEFEAVFSRREYAEARAELIRDGDRKAECVIEEHKVDDPWMMPVKPVPIADLLEVREMARRHSEPIE